MKLNTPVQELNKVGKSAKARLNRLGVFTVRDLLFYFPFRYEDYRTLVPIHELKEGMSVTIKGTIELIANRRTRFRKNITEALISDESGSVRVVWFNQPYLIKNLTQGKTVFISGVVKRDMLGPQFVSPAYELAKSPLEGGRGMLAKNLNDQHPPHPPQGGNFETIHTARLVPMYPLTEGLTQKQIRFLMEQSLSAAAELTDWLPDEIQKKNNLLALREAIKAIHFPKDQLEADRALERLKFDELLMVQLKAALTKLERVQVKAPELKFHEEEIKKFVGSLPFTLTGDQKIAAWEILKNIAGTLPMNRLLSGDVGSWKTVVAAIALYNTALSGYQGILMAPTEILAVQHFKSLKKLLPVSRVVLLTRTQKLVSGNLLSFRTELARGEKSLSQPNGQPDRDRGVEMTMGKGVAKKEILEIIKSGEAQIVVGTHALLSEGVEFKKLGLVIVDEQHRFGVGQRKVIKEKSFGQHPPTPLKGGITEAAHFLSMTATPIPRSLALMIYGDLDVSIIKEMPPGRKMILTRLVEPKNRDKAYEFIRAQVGAGRQVFVVCPLIESDHPAPLLRKEGAIDATSTHGQFDLPLRRGDGRGVSFGAVEKKAVLSEYKKLSEVIFPDLRVAYLHGKMVKKGGEPGKEEVMDDFKNKKFDILVSTSVVEVGVDVPNATVMMIEDADRFGLAQLHQFRGRVGRGEHQSYCFLFTNSVGGKALERLEFFVSHNDGFSLAEKDLEQRGPGEVYGTVQSGMAQLQLAKMTDREIIKKAREAAKELAPRVREFPGVVERIAEWERGVHLE